MATPTDPLYGQQWHLPLIGDIETVWNDYIGTGIKVAVYDDGLERTHQDLAANYDGALHFQSDGTTYDPLPTDTGTATTSGNAHGTAAAGLIGSVANNEVGGVGVAYGAKLTGVPLLTGDLSTDVDLGRAALSWATRFDVMSNSWGPTQPDYNTDLALTNPDSTATAEAAIMGTLSATGRDNKGTILVNASGNETMNANGDGMHAARYVISVSATEQTGLAADYTNYGANILVAGPAAAVTTDLSGDATGYNRTGDQEVFAPNTEPGDNADTLPDTNYTSTFSGTSAATPVVAGVTALMLQANGSLGWRDVQNILAASAAQTGSTYGQAGTLPEQGRWFETGTENFNGGGHTFHYSYGFGMVDAFAAVRMAEVWGRLNGPAKTSANELTAQGSAAAGTTAVAVNGTTDIPITVTGDIEIEHVNVTLNITHSASADLVLSLIAPDGTEFVLMRNEGQPALMQDGFNWTFGVTGALDKMSAGEWRLRIVDENGSGTGNVESVALDFQGAPKDTNDVFHFTKDLFALAGIEQDRAMVSDTNGGTDWLNLAAMGNTAVTVHLDDKTVDFAGQALQLGLTGDFEHVVTSDGNDGIKGNALANTLMGMRGQDKVEGGQGNDVAYGGTGNDQLFGNYEGIARNGGVDLLYGEAGDDSGTLSNLAATGTKQLYAGLFDGGTGTDGLFLNGDAVDYNIFKLGDLFTFRHKATDGEGAQGRLVARAKNIEQFEGTDLANLTVTTGFGARATTALGTAPTDLAAIRDFDGNDLGSAGSWKQIGQVDIQFDGDAEFIYINRDIERWATVGSNPDGTPNFADHGQGGETRVVGIYIDPLVQSGQVQQGSDIDSQRRFQNDLAIDNLTVIDAFDFDGDTFQEIYFKVNDGTAYLRALMHADGNIQYANYQNTQQVRDYLTGQGFGQDVLDTILI